MISTDFINKYGAQQIANNDALGFVSQTDDFIGSTVVDVATTLFNSVISLPKLFGIDTDEYTVATRDVLNSVNEDWANYYDQSKDLVETASFISGVLLPGGAAFKGMKMLQAGKLGFYPTVLADAAQAKRMTELTQLLELGKKSTSDFRNLRWKILAANAGQETMQAAGAELAILATMNQHAWFEDYLKDPIPNFAISLGIGGVLGTGIGQLIVRRELRNKLGAVATTSMDKVISQLVDIPLGITDVDKVQRYSINADILRGIAENEQETGLTRQIASDFATRWEGMAGKLEQSTVFGQTLKATKDTAALQQAREIMLSDQSFGANRVDFLTYDPKTFNKQPGTHGALLMKGRQAYDDRYEQPNIPNGHVRLYRVESSPEAMKGVVSNETGFAGITKGSWFVKDIKELAYAAPVGQSGVGIRYIDVPAHEVENFSVAKNHQALEFDANAAKFRTNEYIIPKEKLKDVKNLFVGEDSYNRLVLGAAGSKIKQTLTLTEGLKAFTPNWAKLMKKEFSTLYSPYHKAWVPFDEIHNYSRAVDTGKTTWEKVNVFKPNPDAFTEFAVRNIPTATADSYWINTLGTVAAAPLEQNIYIMASDLGVQNGWLSRLSALEAEGKPLPKVYLVPEEAGAGTVAEMRKKATRLEYPVQDLEENLYTRKERLLKSLVSQGASMQEIGIRLNLPVAAVEAALMRGGVLDRGRHPWRNYTNAGAIESEYMAQTTRTLSFSTNGHRLASLAFRNSDMSANLDSAAIKRQNREMMANIIASSPSTTAREFFQVLNKDDKIWDLFEQQLGNIVNEKSGSFFFSSADFASRDMGDISRIATIKGQELFGLFNNVSQQMLTKLSSKVRAATQTQLGINEFNDVINILQSTSGFRDIDPSDGMLFKLIEQEPGVFTKELIKRPDGTHLDLSPAMRDFLLEMRSVSKELWHMKNTINKIQGFKELNDIGLWIPAFNPINKFLSYVIDTEASEGSSRVKLLIGKTPEELARLEQDWKAKNGSNPRFKLVTKSQQEDYNFWQMRTDPTEMDFSDISRFHSGASGSAARIVDDSFASTIIENLHNRVIFYGRKMQEMYLDDIMSTLDNMSAVNQKYFANQPTLVRAIGLSQREDAARSIKNILLGNPNLNQYSTWQTVNNGFASMIEWGARKTQELYRGFFEFDEAKGALKKSDYVRLSKELEGIGVKNPFKGFNDYLETAREELAKLPKIKEGYVRLYRADVVNPEDSFAMNNPTMSMQQIQEYEKHVAGKYEFFTSSLDAIDLMYGPRDFAREGGVKVKYIDLPRAEADRLHAAVHEIGKRFEPGAENEYVIPTSMKTNMVDFTEMWKNAKNIGDVNRSGIGKGAFFAMSEQLRIDATARRLGTDFASAERIVAAGNSALATMALRVLETGHALVTAISWPIMMLPEFSRAMPKTYLGNALGEGIEVPFPARAIYDGIRFRNSAAAKPLIDRWIREGFGESIVSEATRLNTLIHSGGKDALGQINKILESDLIKKLSTPSDYAEKETRLWALSIGFQLARRMYPGISDTGADLFAKEFLTKTIGNYYSAQRPVMFQGTLGVAIGLFQTYMLTWAQQAFRSIEEKNFKALASQMLAQAGLFGMGSTPMYDLFSKTIGEHFSDKHYDLQSGTYRALPDPLAEFIVYGLPASLGVGLYTRGDMQPRIPFTQDSVLDTIAAVNATKQVIAATGHTLKKVMQANDMGEGVRGLLEGIAMQSLSRPMARVVEAIPLPDGQGGFRAVGAISREGNTIATSDEIWSGPGLVSRLLASRSTEEQVKREVDYLNTFYGSVDFRNRKKATESLKSAIRGGNLSQETLEQVAGEYLRTGTATGWKAALNEALATSEGGIDYKLGKRLRPDSPLLKMIDENY